MVFGNFLTDGVTYMEIRSGPKKFEDLSKVEYIETIVKKIVEF